MFEAGNTSENERKIRQIWGENPGRIKATWGINIGQEQL
jgi:hypothetical protein